MSTLARAPVKRTGQAPTRQTVDGQHHKILSQIESAEDEIEYYKDTAHLLFYYYNSFEVPNQRAHQPTTGTKQKSVLDMLNDTSISNEIQTYDPDDEYVVSPEDDPATTDSREAKDLSTLNRAQILDRFMRLVDDSYIPSSNSKAVEHACPHCGNTELTTISAEAMSYCPECDTVEDIIVESDKPGFKDSQKMEISYFCYKRSNHFQEWISQTQGREHTCIPDSVYDEILTELKKQKIDNVANLKMRKLKEVMKKLHMNRYFEHISHILCHLKGTPVVNMPPELETKLRRMFQLIQAPFLIHSPPSRKNFLSYAYVIHKFLQLLGEDEYLAHFQLLKSRHKLHAQDVIWKKICETLKWEFIPSL